MRIKQCNITAYGQFKKRSFENLNHPIVVVQGKNETGKSTFFHFMRSMLYGFNPDQALVNKYAPLDGDPMEGDIVFTNSHSEEMVVSRKLDAVPTGYLLNGTKDDLGNKTIPLIDHISRPVFESVYTLGLYDMIEFSRLAWDKIQDRLLGSLNVGHIRSAKDAIRSIEREASSIWRNEIDSMTALRKIDLQQRELKNRIRTARENDTLLRELINKVGLCEDKERELEEEQIRLKADRRRFKRLYPVLRLVEKMNALRELAEDVDNFQHIPEDPHLILDTLSDQIEKDQDKLEYAKRDIRYAQANIQKLIKSLLTENLTKESLKAIRDLPDVELRHQVYACQEALGSLREVQMYAKMLSVRASASKPIIPWVILLIISAIMIVVGGILSWTMLWMVGTILFLVGTVQGLEVARHNRNIGYEGVEEWPDITDYEIESEERKEAIREILAEIPLPEIRLENPDLELVSDIETLKVALDDYDQQVRKYTESEKDFKISNRSTLNKIKQLKEPLLKLGSEDLLQGARLLMEKRKAARQADQYEETLNQEYPNWREMLGEIDEIREEEGEMVFTDVDVVRIETRLELIDSELKTVVSSKIEHSKDIERLQTETSIVSLKGELALLDKRKSDLEEQRDRLHLLANIFKKADAQFRVKHQPEVIRLAGEYLAHVTDGRYNRLGIDEETGELLVYAQDGEVSYKVAPPLSQGTCDQIYLAIRLAIIDHLDEGKERLPVFLDEVFVNWDVSRRKNVYGILKKMSEKRQIFLFTCHAWQAEEARAELDAHNILLTMQN
ncbi:MAG: AAA family ATPase [Rhodothermaceae bacterium]|nr:AAA family ATPase [Rhodothermaceae bacterium]